MVVIGRGMGAAGRLGDLERGRHERHLGGIGAVVARQGDELLLERHLHLADVREAILGTLGERPAHDRRDAVGGLGAALLNVGDRGAQVLARDLDERRAAVGRPAREAVVEQRPERVDVGAPVEREPLRLLGRHVVAGAEHAAGVGERGGVVDARDAEIGQLGVPVLGQQDVVGLHVAVDHAALVGIGEGRGDLDGDRERLRDGKAALERDPLVQVAPVHQLADDERAPVGLAAVDHGDDPGVRQQSERARLALEAIDRIGRLEAPGVQQLDRDGAAELLVIGLPHARHASAAEQALDAEPSRERLADHPESLAVLHSADPRSRLPRNRTA